MNLSCKRERCKMIFYGCYVKNIIYFCHVKSIVFSYENNVVIS